MQQQLFGTVGNLAEHKRLLTHTLKLEREWGDDHGVTLVLRYLSSSNWRMDLTEEGIQQAKEALEIYEQLGDTKGQTGCLIRLTLLLSCDNQFEAAEEAALRTINLSSEKGDQFRLCDSHRALGYIYDSKGETKKAIHHLEVALGIASPFNWHDQLFGAHHYLAWLFCSEGRLDDANTHIERAKLHTDNSAYHLGAVMETQAVIWHMQHGLEDARSETLCAIDIYEKVGTTKDIEGCRKLLRNIERELDAPVASSQ